MGRARHSVRAARLHCGARTAQSARTPTIHLTYRFGPWSSAVNQIPMATFGKEKVKFRPRNPGGRMGGERISGSCARPEDSTGFASSHPAGVTTGSLAPEACDPLRGQDRWWLVPGVCRASSASPSGWIAGNLSGWNKLSSARTALKEFSRLP